MFGAVFLWLHLGANPLRSSRPVRHRIGLALLIVGLATGVWTYSGGPEPDGAKTGPPSEPAAQVDTGESADEVDGDHLPWSVYLKRLGANEGGVWKATVTGGRVILYLGAPGEAGDSFLAVLWESKDPKFRLFEVFGLLVDLERGVAIDLFFVEGHASWVPVRAYGNYVDGKFRIDKVRNDEEGSLPAKVTLERCSGKPDDEVVRLRARFLKKMAEDPYDR